MVTLIFDVFTLFMWFAIRSQWFHLNLVPTRLCVLSKCFWVSSRSHCSHLNSLEKACVAKVPNNELFQYIRLHLNIFPIYWPPLFINLDWSFLITLLTFILDSFLLTLFMQDKNLYLIALLSHWLNSYLIISCWDFVLLWESFWVPLSQRSHLYILLYVYI